MIDYLICLQSTVSFEAPTMKSPPTKAPTVEKSVSFEEPQKVDTLTNLTKVRTYLLELLRITT